MKFCSLFSGSSGNSLYIEADQTKILIDAGLSGKKITNALDEIDVNAEELDAIVISHDHSDHIKGAGVLSRRYNIPIYANEGTWLCMENCLGKIKENNIKVFTSNKTFEINDIHIHTFGIHHDAKDPVGFSIHYNNKKISIVTDTGIISENIFNYILDSDLLIIESNHDIEMLKVGRYPYFLKRRILSENGHLSNDDAAKTILSLVQKGLKRVVLAHLSEENNFPQLAYETTNKLLLQNDVIVDRDVSVEVATRFRRSKLYKI